jgi:SLT domain-containing protein/phage-related protein
MATAMRALGFSIFSTYDGNGVREARRDMDSFNGSVNRSTSAMNSWNGRIILATKAIAVFGPALVPIAAHFTAIAGAATAMASTVGIALGSYGLAMKNAIDTTTGMAKAGKALSDQQKEFLKTQDSFNKAMVAFGSSFRDESLKAATATLKGLTNILKGLEPVARAIAPEVTKVAQAFEKWSKSPQFKAYVDMIKASAVPAFRDLVAAGKDVLNVLGDGFRAFLPSGVQLAQTLREGAAAMRQWSDGGGFQRFLEYASQNAGPVREFFRALWDAFKNILEAAKQLGPFALGLTTTILKLVAALPPEWIEAIVKGFVAWKVALAAIMTFTKIVAFLRGLAVAIWGVNAAMSANVIGLIVIAIAALVAGIILLVKNWDTVSGALVAAWNATWNAMKIAVEAVWNALKTAWNAVSQAFITAWQAVSGALTTAWNAVWNAMKVAVEAVWNALKAAWNAVVMAFQTAWTTVSTALVTAWNAVWTGMSTAVQAVWTALQTAWNAVVNAFQTVWTTVSTALVAAWNAVWTGMSTAVQAVWTALQAAWNAVVNAFQTVWTTVSTALVAAWNAVWTGMSTAVQAIWTALQAAWNAVVNAFQTVWSTISSALSAAWNTFWSGIQTAAQAIWTAMQTAWNAFLTAVQTVWNTISAALKTAWDAVWNALKTAAQAIWTALQTAWQAFLTAVQTVWTTVSTALKTAWDAFWNAVKTAAETIWNALKAAWQAFLTAARTIWDTFSAALKAVWDTFWNAIKTAAQAVWEALQNAWNGILKAMRTIWDTFSGAFEKAWESTWNTVKGIAQKVWSAIGGIIEKAINAVITIINGLIKGFNAIVNFLHIDVKIGEIDKVNLPGFAEGGIVTFAYGGMTGKPPTGCKGKGCGGGYANGGVANLRNGGTLRGYAPGRDTVPAMLSKGEGVLTPEAVRGLGGPGFVHGANREFAGHRGAGKPGTGFSMGGIQHFAVGGITAAALSRAGVPLSMISQGEHSDGSLSGGTHLGGGAVDISSTDPALLQRLIASGFAAWIRGPAQGFSPHIHAVLMGHPDLSGAAAAQVADFKNGGDGLGAGGGGGGGGILQKLAGMLKGHIGMILKNVYMGYDVLKGVPGVSGIMSLLGMDDDDDGGLFGTGIGPDVGPNVADAIGDAVGAVTGIGGEVMDNIGRVVLSMLDKGSIAEGLSDATGKLKDFGLGGKFGDILVGLGKKITDVFMPDFLMKKSAEAGPLPTASGNGDVTKWASLAVKALRLAGLDAGQLDAFLRLMQAESGGNPNAINKTDINARNGNPSQGLMQVTGSTFAAYRDPSLPNDPTDPLANMVAAANYIQARYGGNVPGSPYNTGTNSATEGLHLVGERGPEMIAFGGGERVFNGMETSSMMNQGIEASLKGRSFEAVIAGAKVMAASVKGSWNTVVTDSATAWSQMTPVLGEVSTNYGTSVPASMEAMRAKNAESWTDMNLQSATNWGLMRDGTFAESQIAQTTTMPEASLAMATASNEAWAGMSTTATEQYSGMDTGAFTPFETTMTEDVPGAAGDMNTGVSTETSDMAGNVIDAVNSTIGPVNQFMDTMGQVISTGNAAASAISGGGAGGGGMSLQAMDDKFAEYNDALIVGGYQLAEDGSWITPKGGGTPQLEAMANELGKYNDALITAGYTLLEDGTWKKLTGYADGTDSAAPGVAMVGEEGPELVGTGGPMLAAFSGGQTVLPAGPTADLMSGGGLPTTSPSSGATGDVALPDDEMQKLLNQGGFEGVAQAASSMAAAIEAAWMSANSASASEWSSMRDSTLSEAVAKYGIDMVAAANLMRETSNAAWLDMNIQSALQWTLMRDTTMTEAEFHLGTQMPLMITTMHAAWNAAWLDMQVQSLAQWTLIRDGVFLPMEEHMGVTMIEAATAMNEGVSEAFTAMGEVITTVLDAGIAKMDEFIAKAQEAIAVTAELVAAVAEAQAAMAALNSMGTPGAAGGAGGAGGDYEAIAAEALAAAGISADQLPAFMALMMAESGGDPNAINNWDSNAAAGTPSMGLMQMIQPTFDAYNVTGGNIMDPRANMFASAAYIAARYGGVVPGSPYARGTNSATPGVHLVGENGPELVGMDGQEYAWFRGGEQVLTNADTQQVLANAVTATGQALIPELDKTIAAIDMFIATAKAGIEKAKAITAAAKAAAAARAAGAAGGGSGPCTMPNAPIIQGPYNAGGVAASAGTHDGGGVYDFPADQAVLQQLLSSGWAAWMRGNGDGMDPHIHAVCMSATDLSPQAAWQVQDFQNGGSGLGIPALGRGTKGSYGGWRVVGDRGPELMRASRGDQVMPNRMSRQFVDEVNGVRGSAHSCGEGGVHVELNFNGPVNNGDDVRRAVDEAIPKLRQAVQAKTGCRSGR